MRPGHPAFERVHIALVTLATSPAPLLDRLFDAGMTITVFNEREFRAGEERDLYLRVVAALTETAQPVGDEGTILASLRVMDDERMRTVARDIVNLHDLLYS
jgi:hypothetical protein